MVEIMYNNRVYEALEVEGGYLLIDSGIIVPVTEVIYLQRAA